MDVKKNYLQSVVLSGFSITPSLHIGSVYLKIWFQYSHEVSKVGKTPVTTFSAGMP